MHHYIYKITNHDTNQFYIGKKSSSKLPDKDTYYGSGHWILNLTFEITGRLHKGSVYKKSFEHTNISKQILCICNSEIEAYNKEKYYISIHKDDKSCMNMNGGGKGFSSGKLHPKHDDQLYIFKNINGDDDIVATKSEMIKFLKCHKSCVYDMVKNERPHVIKGYYFAGTPERPLTIDLSSCNMEKHKRYDFINCNGEIVNKTRSEMAAHIDVGFSSIQALVEGRTKTIKGFALYKENVNFKEVFKRHIKYNWIYKNGKKEYMTTVEMKNKYNLKASLAGVATGKTNSYKGWSLLKEQGR